MKRTPWWPAVLALAVGAGMAAGAEISLEQAETAVGNWMSQGGGFGWFSGAREVSGKTLEDAETGAKMHVVRVPGKGFVVTSTDDGIEPVILFSEGEGEFEAAAGTPLWDLLRRDLAARRKGLEDGAEGGRRGAGSAAARAKWAALLPEWEGPQKRANGLTDSKVWSVRRRPLLKTSWNQTEGTYGGTYNLFTPGKRQAAGGAGAQAAAAAPGAAGWVADVAGTNDVGHYPVGCVAVAGGQVMKHWAHPENAAAKTMECRVDGETRNLEFFGSQVVNGTRTGSYGWDSMGGGEPVPGLSSEYVSRLLSDIGVACGAHYRASGTGMALARLAAEMKSTFGYAGAVHHTANLSGSGLRQVLIPNLDAGAPVMLGIGNAHAVVADGYGFDADESTFLIHVNLGWGQATHYWYVPPDIDKYSSIDEIVCNVFPDFAGVVLSGRVTGPKGRPVYKMSMLRDGTTHGAAETGADGIYHFRLGAGTYRVWGQAQDGTEATGVQSVTLPEMGPTENGNRVLDFRASNAETVGDIAVGTVSRDGAKGSGGAFSEPFDLTLACATEGAEIHYTLDGSDPGEEAPVYGGPIAIQTTTRVRAVAFAPGMECSEMLDATYTFADPTSRDNFADARAVSGASGRSSFENAGYTKEEDEPKHSDVGYTGGASAWAVWTAPSDGDWTFWLEGTKPNGTSGLDTQLAVYTGDSLESLTRVAANDDTPAGGLSSRVSIHATGGTAYKIAMDTYYGEPGSMILRWEGGFIHYVRFKVEQNYPVRFVPKSGGRVEVGILSSTNWWFVECSEPVHPEITEGIAGDVFACTVDANGTGAERTEYASVQSGNSEPAALSIRQHPMDFATTKEEAVERAWRENKRILLVRGREACGNTRATLFSSIPSPAVKGMVDAGYVLWYSNCDRQSDSSAYAAGGYLPTVAILDPLDLSKAVAATNGSQSADALPGLLGEHSSWGGLPRAQIEWGEVDVASTTAKVRVRKWGAGAESATVALETGSDAAFSVVTATETLGTVTELFAEHEWTFGTTEGGFRRLRVTSGDWTVVRVLPVRVALDRQGGWYGSTSVLATYGEALPPVSIPSLTGHTFGGYFSGPDGTGTPYISASGSGARNWDLAGTPTLYARWIPKTYTATLDRQGGTGGSASVTATYGEKLPPVEIPSAEGLDFAGYYTEPNGAGAQYCTAAGKGAKAWTIAGDATLYAHWVPHISTVVVDGVVYSEDLTTLILYPAEKEGAIFTVPATVTNLAPGCFAGTQLRAVQFPGNAPAATNTCFGDGTILGYYTKGAAGWTAKDEDGAWGDRWNGIRMYPIPEGGMETLWGTTDYHYEIVDGIVWVFVVSDGEASLVPKPRQSGAWRGEACIPSGITGEIAIPPELGGCPVGRIGAEALSYGSYTSVSIPHSVRTIADGAFYYAGSQFASVTIPNSVTNIGKIPFEYCLGLREIAVESGNGHYAAKDGILYNAEKTELVEAAPGLSGSLAVPGTVTNIQYGAFYSCRYLTSLALPDSVETIGTSAFSSSGLARLEVPGAWWGKTEKLAGTAVPSGCVVAYRGIEPLAVATETLPAGMEGEWYETALTVSGGMAPHAWRAGTESYAEGAAAGRFEETGTAQGWRGDDGCWKLALPFAFPFGGKTHTNAVLSSNGTISFGGGSFTAAAYDESLFRETPMVAVLWADLTTEDGDVYVETGSDRVTVRWSGSYCSGGAVNFSATLHKNGKIALSYGAGNAKGGTIGVSAGDGAVWLLSGKSGSGSLAGEADIVFRPSGGLPAWLELTPDGVLRGMPPAAGDYAVEVTVEDAAGVAAGRTLALAVGEEAKTERSPVRVPLSWLEGKAAAILADAGGDYEAAAAAAAANRMPVWECYLAGLDPMDEGAKFLVKSISFVNGQPKVTWDPDLNEGGTRALRAYRVMAKKSLDGDEEPQDVTTEGQLTEKGWRFFWVEVEMP